MLVPITSSEIEILLLFCAVLEGPARNVDVFVVDVQSHEQGPEYAYFLFLVDCVGHFEDLPAHELIIAIDTHGYA